MRLHERLRHILKDKLVEYNEAGVAEELGVRPTTLNQWLNGVEPCGQSYLAQIVSMWVGGDAAAKRIELRRLFLLLDQERVTHERTNKWKHQAKELAEAALQEAISEVGTKTSRPIKTAGRTLQDFPESFYPLAVISGDKREESESRITIADFGAVSASPAESRWLFRLGLRQDVEFFGDKIFVLESVEELKERFAERNLLVIGSPGSNHLARRLHLATQKPEWRHGTPIFRFNLYQHFLNETEKVIERLSHLSRTQLVGERANPRGQDSLKHQLRHLFTGGILDPTYHGLWKRAAMIDENRDFGFVTLARNPFSRDDKYVAILATGFHMFGTAHALKFLAEPDKFRSHPLGGVIRVDFNDHQFGKRFDESKSDWDKDEDRDSGYTIEQVADGLKKLSQDIQRKTRPDIQLTNDQLEDCLEFIKAL